ncbi:MAG: hypothetical protein NTZ13_01730 [Candidatus Parcubacteria bacterium]|nr:hypothetical protein [Candidatus Parcubacteria bacterium]
MKTTSVLKQLTAAANDQLCFWKTAKKTGLVTYDFGNDIVSVETGTGDDDKVILMTTGFLISLFSDVEHTPYNALLVLESTGLDVMVVNCRKYITPDYLAELCDRAGFSFCEAVE